MPFFCTTTNNSKKIVRDTRKFTRIKEIGVESNIKIQYYRHDNPNKNDDWGTIRLFTIPCTLEDGSRKEILTYEHDAIYFGFNLNETNGPYFKRVCTAGE